MTQEYEPYPLDFEILRRLPNLGSKVGYHTLGTTVKALARELKEGGATSAQLGGRLKSMQSAGLVVPVTVLPVGDGKGWQITPKGKSLLANHGIGLALVDSPADTSLRPRPGETAEQTIDRVVAAVRREDDKEVI